MSIDVASLARVAVLPVGMGIAVASVAVVTRKAVGVSRPLIVRVIARLVLIVMLGIWMVAVAVRVCRGYARGSVAVLSPVVIVGRVSRSNPNGGRQSDRFERSLELTRVKKCADTVAGG